MSDSSPEDASSPSSRLDTGVAHSARVWNYLLGGTDNFAADREIGELILQAFPGIARLLPPGSYLALSDGTDTSPELNQAIAAYNQNSANSYHLRSPGLSLPGRPGHPGW